MAGRDFRVPMESNDFAVLAQALRDQQNLLQKVCAELESEREAASSAANEAMWMMLRLQAEKAKLKMEMEHYQRQVEETLTFAKDSLAGFEDLMQQKEMEMEYLESQVQAYTSKLLTVGCASLLLPESQQLQRKSNSSAAESDFAYTIPVVPSELCPMRISVEKSKSGSIPVPKLFKKAIEREDLSVYWERIQKLDEQVKKLSDKVGRGNSTSPRNKVRSCSVPPPNFDDFSLVSLVA